MFRKHVSTESTVIFSLNYKAQGWINSVHKIVIDHNNKRKHDNVKYYKESFKLTW